MKIPRFLWALVVGLVVGLGISSAASAHASLDNSAPASGATVATSPPQIVLDFDEQVETALGYIRL